MSDDLPPIKLEPRAQVLGRLTRFSVVANEIADGLEGRPFSWRAVDAQHGLPVARTMGITLVSKTRAEKLGYELKRNQSPVGHRYFRSPISGFHPVYVLECQFVKKAAAEQGTIDDVKIEQEAYYTRLEEDGIHPDDDPAQFVRPFVGICDGCGQGLDECLCR